MPISFIYTPFKTSCKETEIVSESSVETNGNLKLILSLKTTNYMPHLELIELETVICFGSNSPKNLSYLVHRDKLLIVDSLDLVECLIISTQMSGAFHLLLSSFKLTGFQIKYEI